MNKIYLIGGWSIYSYIQVLPVSNKRYFKRNYSPAELEYKVDLKRN